MIASSPCLQRRECPLGALILIHLAHHSRFWECHSSNFDRKARRAILLKTFFGLLSLRVFRIRDVPWSVSWRRCECQESIFKPSSEREDWIHAMPLKTCWHSSGKSVKTATGVLNYQSILTSCSSRWLHMDLRTCGV